MSDTKNNLADYAAWDIDLSISDDGTAFKLEVTHTELIELEEFIDMLRTLANEFSDAGNMIEGEVAGHYH